MRLDLYLKLTRLVKRRTIAQEMVAAGAVRLEGRTVKPAAEVREGNRVEVGYPRRLLVLEVLLTDETALRRGGEGYRVLEDRKLASGTSPWENASDASRA